MRGARSIDFAVVLQKSRLRLKNAPHAKSLIFQPPAAGRPDRGLRLLSCHPPVGRSPLHGLSVKYSTMRDNLRTMVKPAIKRSGGEGQHTKRLIAGGFALAGVRPA